MITQSNDALLRKRAERSQRRSKENRKLRDHRAKPKSKSTNPEHITFSEEGYNAESCIREEALRNIIHGRSVSNTSGLNQDEIKYCTQNIRREMRRDITNHIDLINPEKYVICRVCGRHVSVLHTMVAEESIWNEWLTILEHQLYPDPKNKAVPYLCVPCVALLRRNTVPFRALKNGWTFLQAIPNQLSTLSAHEKQLICLRLPSIFMIRTQGGFGQQISKGAPVCFSNPVADLATKLPRKPSVVFKILLEQGRRIEINSKRVRDALLWLHDNNPLYSRIEIDATAFEEINDMMEANASQVPASGIDNNGNHFFKETRMEARRTEHNNFKRRCIEPMLTTEIEEEVNGVQGPLDMDALRELSMINMTGIDDSENPYHAKLLIQHMLTPFVHHRKHMLPSYDALSNLESYFPVLFPYGKGGPQSLGCSLGKWIKVALSVYCSRFAKDLEFIFFVYSVLKRKRITGLCSFAPISRRSDHAISEVRDLLSSSVPASTIAKRIDYLLRSGALNASFETLKGSPTFWATLRRKAWAYLTRFGPCQIFLTMSVADVTDLYLYCEADPSLTFSAAQNLSSKQRADILASNPVSAVSLFHRRVQSLFKNFLFGETKPFGGVLAYLGRVEQQARFSPHLHLLIWLERKCPTLSEPMEMNPEEIVNFIVIFSTAVLPPETPISDVPRENSLNRTEFKSHTIFSSFSSELVVRH